MVAGVTDAVDIEEDAVVDGEEVSTNAQWAENVVNFYGGLEGGWRDAFWWGMAFVGGSFAYSCYTYYKKWSSPKQRKRRNVARNFATVTEVDALLKSDMSKVTPSYIRELRRNMGFTKDEIFRKECRYMLSEREFDAACVAQLLHLRDVCELTVDETAAALEESAKRIHKKYGNVMFKPSGMTETGVAKKATACALFSKLLYLFESPEMLGELSEAATGRLKNIFGAVDEDCDRLRIESLTSQADLEALDRPPSARS
eukprot:PRCOL_00005587-RA